LLTANQRDDIFSVATFGGGLVSLAEFCAILPEAIEQMVSYDCSSEDSFELRSGIFWVDRAGIASLGQRAQSRPIRWTAVWNNCRARPIRICSFHVANSRGFFWKLRTLPLVQFTATRSSRASAPFERTGGYRTERRFGSVTLSRRSPTCARQFEHQGTGYAMSRRDCNSFVFGGRAKTGVSACQLQARVPMARAGLPS